MEPSIFYTIKRMLGVTQENDAFDLQIQLAINSALTAVNQLGIGPEMGFRVTGVKETWEDLIGDRVDIDAIQAYIFLKVRLLFDPPTNSFLVTSIVDQIREIEWRLVEQVDERRRQVGDKDHSFGGFDSDSSWSQGDEMGSTTESRATRASETHKTEEVPKTNRTKGRRKAKAKVST